MSSADGTEQVVKERLRAVCQALLGADAAPVFLMQIGRVLIHIAPWETCEAITAPAQVVAVFRHKGLIPPALIKLGRARTAPQVEQVTSRVEDEAFAVCFAACAYPQRAFQMGQTELGLRVESFRLAYDAIAHDLQVVNAEQVVNRLVALKRLPATFARADIALLLSDLSGAESTGGQDAQQAAAERSAGAALHLASCCPELVGIMCARWRDEAQFMRYLRRFMPTSPSCLTREAQVNESWPRWSRVQARLTDMLAAESPACQDAALILEQMVWKEAARWTPTSVRAQSVSDFWELQWDKLTAGFPYYAFRSHFTFWWKQCLFNHHFSERKTVPPDEIEINAARRHEHGTIGEQPQIEFTPALLSVYRVGIRLIRATFYKRRPMKDAEPHVPTDHAAANEQLRRCLDAIWYQRLETQLGDELPPEAIKNITLRFTEIDADAINTYCHRLRMRVWAYALARLGERLSNEQIREWSPKGRGTEHPLKNEPAVLTIASLARMIPSDQTLLPAFTAHVFLHSQVEPQRPDPWSFKRYLRELWHWLREERFGESVSAGVEQGSRAHEALAAALHAAPFKEIRLELQSLQTEDELDGYLAGQDFEDAQEAALDFVRQLVGGTGLSMCSAEALRAWRQKWEREGQHWIVPVWYLTFVERLNPEQVIARLKVDEKEVELVMSLARAMRAAEDA
jgi:hypothetical protein